MPRNAFGVLRSLSATSSASSSSSSASSSRCEQVSPDKPVSRVFLSNPLGESDDTEGQSGRTRMTVIVPSDEEDDFTVEVLEEKLTRVDLCKRFNLQPRDLGALEADIIGRRAQIFVRPGTIVYSAQVRAIIRRDKLLLFEKQDFTGEEATQYPDCRKNNYSPSQDQNERRCAELAETLKEEMRRISLQGRQTFNDGLAETNFFEFIALEALLAHSTKDLVQASNALQKRYHDLMETLQTSDQIPTLALQQLLDLKDYTEEFKSSPEEFRQAISDILQDEQDMAKMYLTDADNGKPHSVGDDDEIQLLLEVYRHHAYSFTDLAATLLTRLQSITNHVSLLLSSTRNRLLNLEITLAFLTLGAAVGSFIGAIFGMNLLSGLEEERYVFYGMTAAAILLAVVTARWGRLALKRARSVKGKQDGFARHSIPFFIGHLGRSSEQESAV